MPGPPEERRSRRRRDVEIDDDREIDGERRSRRLPRAEYDVIDRRVAELATRQAGVVSRSQLRELGLGRDAIDHRLATARLFVVHRGVYSVGHCAIGPRGAAIAGLLAVGPRAVLSHRSAAYLWRMRAEPPQRVEVTTVGRRPRRRAGVELHLVAALETGDCRRREGLPVTAPVRTLLDLAAVADPGELEAALREAQVRRLASRGEIDRAVAGAAGRRGIRPLESLLDSGRSAPTRSELERTLLGLIEAAGLPRPAVDHYVGRHLVDFVWVVERVIVEVDGWSAHGHRAAFEHDRARDADLQALGFVVLRFTWWQLTRKPVLTASRIAQVLALGRGPSSQR